MRIAYAFHNPSPDMQFFARTLARELRSTGLTIELIDFADSVPLETDPKLNKETARSLNSKLDGFDIVHCFGYRMSWAMGEHYGDKRPWVYTVLELPGSSHDFLIERLNKSRAGYCASEFVRKRLGWYGADFLKLTKLSLSGEAPVLPTREAACEQLDLDSEQSHIFLFDALSGYSEDAERVRSRVSDANILSSKGLDQHLVFAAASLVVFPKPEQGASVALLQAMAAGAPVMVPEESGLAEYVDDRSTGLWFDNRDALADMIASALQMPIRAESMAQAAQIRVQESENLREGVDLLGRHYRKMIKQ